MTLFLNGPGVRIRISITHFPGSRVGRTLALQFYRSIKPLMRFYRAELFAAHDLLRGYPNQERPLTLAHSIDMSRPNGPFGAALRLRRQLLGLTQDELARMTGMSRHAILRLEKGLAFPRPVTQTRLIAALGGLPFGLPDGNTHAELRSPTVILRDDEEVDTADMIVRIFRSRRRHR
jgi:transcriptional regulator with XRE-family HTH domain